MGNAYTGSATVLEVRMSLVCAALREGVSLKRLYFAASVAAFSVALLSTPLSADAFGSPRISPSVKALPISSKIATSAKAVAMRTSTVGWCYRGVKAALACVGVALSGPAAWMAKGQLLDDVRFVMVPLKALKKGDILVHGRSTSHPYGHIAVYLGNNEEASDHVQALVLGHGYGDTVVFRAREVAFQPVNPNSASVVAAAATPPTVIAQPKQKSAPAVVLTQASTSAPVMGKAKLAIPPAILVAQTPLTHSATTIAMAHRKTPLTHSATTIAMAHRKTPLTRSTTTIAMAHRKTPFTRSTTTIAMAHRKTQTLTAGNRLRHSAVMVAQAKSRTKSGRAEALRHAVAVAQRAMRQGSRRQEALLHAVRVAHHISPRNRTETASAAI